MQNTNITKTNLLVTTAMLTALTTVATMFLKFPIAVGYIHLGDALVMLAAMILPRRYACFSAGIGATLADIFSGYAVWAPFSLIIKIVMVIILQTAFSKIQKRTSSGEHITNIAKIPATEFISIIIGAVWTVAAYYVAEGLLYHNWITPAAGIQFNILQVVVGAVTAIIISTMLYRTPAGESFFYKRPKF